MGIPPQESTPISTRGHTCHRATIYTCALVTLSRDQGLWKQSTLPRQCGDGDTHVLSVASSNFRNKPRHFGMLQGGPGSPLWVSSL